jgi:hypothetical protein
MGNYTTVCIVFFVFYVVISDLNTAENVEFVKQFFIGKLSNKYTHTIIEATKISSHLVSLIVSSGGCLFAVKLPVN